MIQTPAPESFLLKWRGDTLQVTLTLDTPRPGRAAFRTNLGHARIRRREIIRETERGIAPQAKAWTDIPLEEVAPGRFAAELHLDEVGVFSGKACFFPEGSDVPEWPEGQNLHVKVESAETRSNNSIYTVFPRQFGSFREIVRRLDHIMDRMGFKIIQTLPPFPVPTTYAVMGEYGSAFAATDFLSVDPAMAEFDRSATPLDQFRELIDAVHARRGLFLIDLPANHTGWASTLQTHHPDWFRREADGRFISPGAWGVTWEDLVELDYSNAQLRAYMAEVFLFWCRNGADGFRCDAGYMIPAETWTYIVARVREEYPDTVFMLEGLGGRIAVTDRLLAESNLDWAYSEIFQTYTRDQFEWYLPGAIARAEKYGALVHFAETHDNDRLAKGGEIYARLRVQLAALLSWQGAWGIANGVEWYCREKIDVHGKNDLNWGAAVNMVDLIARLNRLLSDHPAFANGSQLKVVTRGGGNTLAVARDGLLVLANLDCETSVWIDWDRTEFSAAAAQDLVSGRKVDASRSVELAPGEVLCLERDEASRISPALPSQEERDCLVHWRFPRDARREVFVPENEWIELSAEDHFRMELIDPQTGRTLRVYRSQPINGQHVVRFDAPHYKGDGTRCRRLTLVMSVYAPARTIRTRSSILIPPQSRNAWVQLSIDGDEVRRHLDDRTVLSNGAGAAAQVRLGWGRIASQYDALLSANPSETVPTDRVNLWARTRAWLQREGYTREFDAKCSDGFVADPAGRGACWSFMMPCGMGNVMAFDFELTLARGENAARLKVTRKSAGKQDGGSCVRLVFRPDLEWRSCHATTKAYQGAESIFSARCTATAHGVCFRPYDGTFALEAVNGVYHHEPQWTYSVGHAEEAARGQDDGGDLFSPGWFSADLRVGESVELIGSFGEVKSPDWCLSGAAPLGQLPLGEGLRQALDLFIVRRDDLKTVIAGYPWFLDWGRDTFIFMRGMIAAGRCEDSLKILQAFAAFEESGTLPNIIYGQTAGNRDTTDAQLWFVRCVQELGERLKDDPRIQALKVTCESIVAHYCSGTPNGIRVDPESGLVWSPSHFTWMDTNYPACTPRVGYPVEIQALWISALRFLGRKELAARAYASVERLFRSPTGNGFADCLDAPNGEPAALARPDFAVRPNQLFLITLGIFNDSSILTATEELLVPGGMRSLSAADPRYRGIYAGDEDTSRKPAYHNGTVWAWVFPQYAEALAATGRCAKETARQFLTTAVENLNSGCRCHLSENADGDAPHAQKGCTAQAWSDSEFLRVWLKLADD